MRNVEKLSEQLGWRSGAFDGFLCKPKAMHQRTYDWLVEALERETRAANSHILRRFGSDSSAVALAKELIGND